MKPQKKEAVSVSDFNTKSLRGRNYKLPRNFPPKHSFLAGDNNGGGAETQNQCDLKRVFDYFDEDGDGKISAAELQSCVRAVGGEELSAEEAEMVVKSSDTDGDGVLGFEDFAQLMAAGGGEEEEEELRLAFGMYDMEGRGCITPKSLKRMLSRLGESTSVEDCKGMIRKFDLNGDGVLSFEEFRIMMR